MDQLNLELSITRSRIWAQSQYIQHFHPPKLSLRRRPNLSPDCLATHHDDDGTPRRKCKLWGIDCHIPDYLLCTAKGPTYNTSAPKPLQGFNFGFPRLARDRFTRHVVVTGNFGLRYRTCRSHSTHSQRICGLPLDDSSRRHLVLYPSSALECLLTYVQS